MVLVVAGFCVCLGEDEGKTLSKCPAYIAFQARPVPQWEQAQSVSECAQNVLKESYYIILT